MRTSLVFSAAILGLAACPASAVEYNTGYFGNVAIEGYDTVAYFTDGKARSGDPNITVEWEGVVWQFATTEHRAMFEADPAAYAPQFGGLCAEGVAFGEISVNLAPEVFEIVEGKLYLNYATSFVDLKGNIPLANSKWNGVHDLLASK